MIIRSNVPCNGCTACCQKDLIILHPDLGDDPSKYETMEAHNQLTGKPDLALKHKPEGGCFYLGPNGCTIHDRSPVTCREFDCRKLFLQFTRNERRDLVKKGFADKAVFEAGRRRL